MSVTHAELLAFNHQMQEFELDILDTKGRDYHVDTDAFAAINEVAKYLNLTPGQVIGVYMHKHYRALMKALSGQDLSSGESLWSRVADLRNYAMMGYIAVMGDTL